MYTLSVWLHIMAAAVWIGGMGFLVFVMVPLLRKPGANRLQLAELMHDLGMRFRTVGWVALALLVVTGTYNMWVRGLEWGVLLTFSDSGNPVMRALTWKLLLVAIVLVMSAIHDFGTGPRATAAWKRDPEAPETLRLRRRAGLFGRANALLALIIVWLAVLVVRGGL